MLIAATLGAFVAANCWRVSSLHESNNLPSIMYGISIISPSSLANYANQLQYGFQHLLTLARRSSRQALLGSGIAMSKFSFIGNFVAGSDVADEEGVESFSRKSISTALYHHLYDIVIIQLHGAHNEIPIAFQCIKQLKNRQESVKIMLLLHRPEEILARHYTGMYNADQNVIQMLRDVDCAVLLGECMVSEYQRLCKKCVAIPHGFFNIPIEMDRKWANNNNSRTVMIDDEHCASKMILDDVICIGSITTWSDMRWISDISKIHLAYLSLTNTSKHLLFYVAGKFNPYKQLNSLLSIDELKLLAMTETDTAQIVSGKSLDDAYENHQFTDLSSMRNWLWSNVSQEGKKIVVVSSRPQNAQVIVLESYLLHFNTQLYRELLMDFYPKVEYSGTLHERPGISIPIVFESASMTDVTEEGLQCLFVLYPKYAKSNKKPSASVTYYYDDCYYPDYRPLIQQIIYITSNSSSLSSVSLPASPSSPSSPLPSLSSSSLFTSMIENNRNIAQNTLFTRIATMYIELGIDLLH